MSSVTIEIVEPDGVQVIELGETGPQGAVGQPIAGATPPATYDPDTHLIGVDVGTGADQLAAGDAPAAARDAAIAAAAIDTDTDVDEEASARSAADNAHVAAPDPHPGYLTPAEGNAAYDALGAAAAALATANADTDTDVGEEAALRVSGDAASIVTANAHADAADNAHTAASDPHPTYTTAAELSTAIASAISGLINGAPGALDTLNELAAALGGDPNFATTIVNALAGKLAIAAHTTALHDTTLGLATDVELAAHVDDLVNAHAAAAIGFTPAGSLSSTDVQNALVELASETSILPAYAVGTLPASGTAGRLVRVTDSIRGVWVDTGTGWRSVSGRADVRDFGADPTKTNDSISAIQAAYDSACLMWAQTYVGGGAYRCDAPFYVRTAASHILGDGGREGQTTLHFTTVGGNGIVIGAGSAGRATITNATWAAGVATYTCGQLHGLRVGDSVAVGDTGTVGFNIIATVLANNVGGNYSKFTVAIASDPGSFVASTVFAARYALSTPVGQVLGASITGVRIGGVGGTAIGVYLNAGRYCNLEDVFVSGGFVTHDGWTVAGWLFEASNTSSNLGSWTCEFQNCSAVSCAADGVYIVGQQCNALIFDRFSASGNEGNGVRVCGGNDIQFHDPLVEGNKVGGFLLKPDILNDPDRTNHRYTMSGLVIDGGYYEPNQLTGWLATQRFLRIDDGGSWLLADVEVRGNYLLGSDKATYAIESAVNQSGTGSIVRGSVKGNTIHSFVTAGVRLAGPGDLLTVEGHATSSTFAEMAMLDDNGLGGGTLVTQGIRSLSYSTDVAVAGGAVIAGALSAKSIAGAAAVLTDAATVSVDASLGNSFTLSATRASRTIAPPTNAVAGQELVFAITNLAGGATATTWDPAGFALAGAWTDPAQGNARVVTFRNVGGLWMEMTRTGADIAYPLPSAFPGLAAWWDLSYLTPVADGTPLANLTSRGVGGTLAQATGGNQALYKTNRKNGLPSLLFDGADDFYSVANPWLAGSAFSLYAVMQRNSEPTNIRMLLDAGGTGANGLTFAQSFVSDDRVRLQYGNGATVSGVPDTASLTDFHIYSALVANSQVGRLYRDGVLVGTGASAAAIPSLAQASLYLGAHWNSGTPQRFFSGELCELILFSVLDAAGQRKAKEGYLGRKYGLAVAA